MRLFLALLKGGIIGGVLLWLVGTGLYLLSHTTYSYAHQVGGATLLGVALGVFVAWLCADVDWSL